ncbi:DUF411 domain-containing protein [Aquisalimonas lutea]|uniref:DUF411 domain-containing protein n=1 Tax=Aquisalimonas lutea TaxID=1327750 RepID=UPI0025B3A5F1|nr:DUF411 domain-containing protein [Aquisalimonas lutea]MDN3519069.1 DUF411 domain-containing protein [Aquisalimonas lutea]
MDWTFVKPMVAAMLLGLVPPAFADSISATLYKNPNCGCCEEYTRHLEANGFDVEMVVTTDLGEIKERYNIPKQLLACHTTIIGNRVFEGHVPAEDIKRFMEHEPMVRGLAIPGMPVGTPGMPGRQRGPIEVFYLKDSDPPEVYATH